MGTATPQRAARCCSRAVLPLPLPPLERPGQRSSLARPSTRGPADDGSPSQEGADQSRRLDCLIKVGTPLAAARATVQRSQRNHSAAAHEQCGSRPTTLCRGEGTKSSPADGRAAGAASQMGGSWPAVVLLRDHRREAQSSGTDRTRPLGASNELRPRAGEADGAGSAGRDGRRRDSGGASRHHQPRTCGQPSTGSTALREHALSGRAADTTE